MSRKAKKSFKAVRRMILALSDTMEYHQHVEFIARLHNFVDVVQDVDQENEEKAEKEAAEQAAKKKLDVS